MPPSDRTWGRGFLNETASPMGVLVKTRTGTKCCQLIGAVIALVLLVGCTQRHAAVPQNDRPGPSPRLVPDSVPQPGPEAPEQPPDSETLAGLEMLHLGMCRCVVERLFPDAREHGYIEGCSMIYMLDFATHAGVRARVACNDCGQVWRIESSDPRACTAEGAGPGMSRAGAEALYPEACHYYNSFDSSDGLFWLEVRPNVLLMFLGEDGEPGVPMPPQPDAAVFSIRLVNRALCTPPPPVDPGLRPMLEDMTLIVPRAIPGWTDNCGAKPIALTDAAREPRAVAPPPAGAQHPPLPGLEMLTLGMCASKLVWLSPDARLSDLDSDSQRHYPIFDITTPDGIAARVACNDECRIWRVQTSEPRVVLPGGGGPGMTYQAARSGYPDARWGCLGEGSGYRNPSSDIETTQPMFDEASRQSIMSMRSSPDGDYWLEIAPNVYLLFARVPGRGASSQPDADARAHAITLASFATASQSFGE